MAKHITIPVALQNVSTIVSGLQGERKLSSDIVVSSHGPLISICSCVEVILPAAPKIELKL